MGKFFSKSKQRPSSFDPVPETSAEKRAGDSMYASPVHSDAVTAVCHVSDFIFASGSKDQSFAVFNLEEPNTELQYRREEAHEKEVTRLVWSGQSQLLYTASRDRLVKAWNKTQEQFSICPAHDLVITGLACSTDGKHLVTGSRDNHVKYWDTETCQCLRDANISRNLVTFLKWAPNSETFVQSSEDKEIKLWDTREFRVSKTLPRKHHIQTCCDINLDEGLVLSCSNGFQSNGCEVTLWDIRGTSSSPLMEFKGHSESVGACSFMPNSKRVVSCGSDQTVRLWSYAEGVPVQVQELPLEGCGPLTSIAHLPNKMCIGSYHLGVQIMEVKETMRRIKMI